MPYETRHVPLMRTGDKIIADRTITRTSITGRQLPDYNVGDVLTVYCDYGGGKVHVARADGEEEMLYCAHFSCSKLA